MTFLNHNDDAVSISPDANKVVFENDKIRILDFTVKAGSKSNMHWHPDNVVYITVGGKLKFTKPERKIIEVDLVSGQVTNSIAGYHELENIGSTEVRGIQIEFKS